MVRETRFAFDPDNSAQVFGDWGDSREHFTEADDRFLEQFTPPRTSARRKLDPKSRSSRRRAVPRHLAGADWLNPGRTPRKPAKRRR